MTWQLAQWRLVPALLSIASVTSGENLGRDSRHYEGFAYADSDGHLLYKEEHFLFNDANGIRSRLVLYRCATGEPFARKWVRNVVTDQAPDFDLVDARLGYREGVRTVSGRLEAFYQTNSHAAMQTASLPHRTNVVIDAGFDAFVRDHWNELNRSDQGHIDFVVPSRLGYVDMRIKASEAKTADGEPVQRVLMTVDAWYAVIAPTIELSYSSSDHTLRRFKGPSNILDAAGKRQVVRIDFPPSAVSAAPERRQIEEAAALPLETRCRPPE